MNGMNVCSWRASALLHMPLALRQARASEKLDVDFLRLKDREPLGDKCPDLFGCNAHLGSAPVACVHPLCHWMQLDLISSPSLHSLKHKRCESCESVTNTKVWPDPRWSKTQFLTPATFSFKILKPKALAFVELQFCFLCYLVFSFCRMLIFIDHDEKWILSSPLLHTWKMQGAFIEFSGRERYILNIFSWNWVLIGFDWVLMWQENLFAVNLFVDLVQTHIPTYQSYYKWFAFVALCFRH